jgi:hypothetical protein
MGHHGKDAISPKEVMVHLKCSPLSNSQDQGRHLQAHLDCLQHRLTTVQSISRPLLPQHHMDNIPGAAGRPPMMLPTKRLQPAAELCRTDVAGIAHLSPVPGISNDIFDADYESDDSSDLGGAQCQAPTSLKQMEFSLKQFAKR